MALTLFFSERKDQVSILRWFLSRSGALDLACGPLECFASSEFQKVGWQLIREHLRAYKKERMPVGFVGKPLFSSPQERRAFNPEFAVKIAEHPPGSLKMIPYNFTGLSTLGRLPLPEAFERSLPIRAGAAKFWKTLDGVKRATSAHLGQ